MRPRQVCRGKGRRAGAMADEHGDASMRPRQVCRGKVPPAQALHPGEEGASMRPRQVCRGKDVLLGDDFAYLLQLQ